MSDLSFDPRKMAIVVIDLQKGIVQRPGSPHPMANVVANCARLLGAARSAGARGVLVHVDFAADGGDRLAPAADQAMGSAGQMPPDWSEFIAELDQQPTDLVILK